jgi:hypothetical protein
MSNGARSEVGLVFLLVCVVLWRRDASRPKLSLVSNTNGGDAFTRLHRFPLSSGVVPRNLFGGLILVSPGRIQLGTIMNRFGASDSEHARVIFVCLLFLGWVGGNGG